MISIRHTGIYVRDIEKLERFYKDVFDMTPICSAEPDESLLLDQLLGAKNSCILTTKLITPRGKETGIGDMLELVKVVSDQKNVPELPKKHPVNMIGMGHLAFGVPDVEAMATLIQEKGGLRETDVVVMQSGKSCCFCRDPEGNWVELIENHE